MFPALLGLSCRLNFALALSATFLLVHVPAVGRAHAAQPPRRPNIVLIMADDMGFSDIGCYGGEIETPHLDRLADRGLRFTQFYNTARCCPTRASLLTGLHPHQAGVGHMTSPSKDAQGRTLPGYQGGLDRHCVTIAQALSNAGYRTYMSGKWHVTRHLRPEGPKHNWPVRRGFEKFYGTIIGAGSFYDPATLCRQEELITPLNDPDYTPKNYYYTDAVTDNAVAFVKQHYRETPTNPFFLYIAYTAAHWPMHALPEDIAKYRGKYDAGYAAVRAERLQRMKQIGLVSEDCVLSPQPKSWEDVEHKAWEARNMEVYAAMVDCMDQGIGRIVEALDIRDQL
ncbi:MAG: sulfatase-like hydrolase/transferase, partial [Planctomycetota bacterium]